MSSPNDHALNRLLLSSRRKTLCYFLNTFKHDATGRLKSSNTQHVLSDVVKNHPMALKHGKSST